MAVGALDMIADIHIQIVQYGASRHRGLTTGCFDRRDSNESVFVARHQA